MSYSNTRSDSEAKAVRIEMEQLRLAAMHYYKDQNSYGDGVTAKAPAEISFLVDPIDSPDSWDIDYRKGWRGPYIKRSLITTIIEIPPLSSLDFNGVGDPTAGIPITPNPPVKLDPYGYPYFFFDLATYGSADSKARIVSMGANGVYDIPSEIVCNLAQTDIMASDYCDRNDVCENLADDVVLCL